MLSRQNGAMADGGVWTVWKYGFLFFVFSLRAKHPKVESSDTLRWTEEPFQAICQSLCSVTKYYF